MAKPRGEPRPDASEFHEQLKGKARHRRARQRRMSDASASSRPPRNDLTPKLVLVDRRLDELTPPRRNVRKRDEAHIRAIVRSIQTVGFCQPILIAGDGAVVDGLIRLEAAKLAGCATIPCIVVDHLNAIELRTLRLALNRLQEKGGWSLNELKIELEELILEDAPIEIAGFDCAEIDQILLDEEESQAGLEDGPLEPNPAAQPIAQSGDVFQLGAHRIICGDARDPEIWRRLMEGERADAAPLAALAMTDVPYNVKIAGNVTGDRHHREFAMASGEMSETDYFCFNLAWIEVALAHLRDGGLLSTFIDWRGLHVVTAAARRFELAMLNLIVWSKTNAGMGSLYRSQHELLPIFKKGDSSHINNVALGKKAGRHRSNVWSYPGASSLGSDARKGLKDHPTVKPTAMLEDALLDLTDRGDVVLDPFLGSGSTLIAAENTGRRCFGIEIDPLYIDVVIRRWEATTGKKAVHASPVSDDKSNGAGYGQSMQERSSKLPP